MIFRYRRCEMFQRDGGRCFLRHIWPSSLLVAQETMASQPLNNSELG